jgi:hypothetical protein
LRAFDESPRSRRNDPICRPEWVRWFDLIVRHYSEPRRLRLDGDGSAFVHYDTRLGDDGVQPVRCIDPQTGVSTWVSDDWDALPTCWGKLPTDTARRLAEGRAVTLWHEHYGARNNPAICAGCNEPMSGIPFGLPTGEAVHSDPDFTCLKLYGRRWRQAAADALAQFGCLGLHTGRAHEQGLRMPAPMGSAMSGVPSGPGKTSTSARLLCAAKR